MSAGKQTVHADERLELGSCWRSGEVGDGVWEEMAQKRNSFPTNSSL